MKGRHKVCTHEMEAYVYGVQSIKSPCIYMYSKDKKQTLGLQIGGLIFCKDGWLLHQWQFCIQGIWETYNIKHLNRSLQTSFDSTL